MKKIVTITALIFSFFLLTSALKAPKVSDYEQVTNNFKNLKVLPQNISKDSLMSLMQEYNTALGVKCNYCHAKDKSADDVYMKEVARHMITLTNSLNVKEFNPIGEQYENAVNCAMCHRGTPKAMTAVKYFEANMKRK